MAETLGPGGKRKGGRPRLVFDRERACQLHIEGWTMREIAAELGVSAMSIQRVLACSTPPLFRNVPALRIDPEPGTPPVQPESPEER